MAFVRCTEIPDSQNATVGKDGVRRYRRVFRVEYDSLDSGGADAIRRIPVQRFDPYEERGIIADYGALAEEAQAEREDANGSFSWLVTVPYSSELWDEVVRAERSGGRGTTGTAPHNPAAASPGNPQSPVEPTIRPAVLKWSVGTMRRAFEYEIAEPTAAAIANSAGDRFDPPLERDVKYPVLTIEQAQSTFDIDTYQPYWDTVNDDFFLGWGRGFVRCESITATSQYDNGYSYWLVNYEFHFHRGQMVRVGLHPVEYMREGWKLIVRDVGRNALYSGVKLPIQVQGQQVVDPVPLDGVGSVLSDADVAAGNFEYRVFEKHLYKNFNDLPLRIVT